MPSKNKGESKTDLSFNAIIKQIQQQVLRSMTFQLENIIFPSQIENEKQNGKNQEHKIIRTKT